MCRWTESLSDATRAIELCPTSCKGHYLTAQASVNMGRLDVAVEFFERALTLGESESLVYRESIEKAMYALLEEKGSRRREEEEELLRRDEALIDTLLEDGERVERDSLGPEIASEMRTARAARVQGMRERIKGAMHRPEVPEALTCSITFELMKDPVIVIEPPHLPPPPALPTLFSPSLLIILPPSPLLCSPTSLPQACLACNSFTLSFIPTHNLDMECPQPFPHSALTIFMTAH